MPTKQGTTKIYADTTIDMLKAVRQTRLKMDQNAAPLLVHCSAGVGRTGTFIVIDQVITALEQGNNKIDIVDLIRSIREDRMALVQHTIQYKFAYQACLLFASRFSKAKGAEVFSAHAHANHPSPARPRAATVTVGFDYADPAELLAQSLQRQRAMTTGFDYADPIQTLRQDGEHADTRRGRLAAAARRAASAEVQPVPSRTFRLGRFDHLFRPSVVADGLNPSTEPAATSVSRGTNPFDEPAAETAEVQPVPARTFRPEEGVIVPAPSAATNPFVEALSVVADGPNPCTEPAATSVSRGTNPFDEAAAENTFAIEHHQHVTV